MRNQFIRMFSLEAHEFDTEVLRLLAHRMTSLGRGSESSDVQAGYVYLGQFIDHDMTRLARGDSQPGAHGVPVADLVQLRTPSLDLDSVYGTGFNDPLCDVTPDGKMKLGDTVAEPGASATSRSDLPRDPSTRMAIIPDDRNDENLLVAQMHVLFLKLHNNIFELVANVANGVERFNETRAEVIRLYHDVVVHDFLKQLLDPDVYNLLLANNPLYPSTIAQPPGMPIEFAGAGFRYGHSMIRQSYRLNPRKLASITTLLKMTGKHGFKGQDGVPEQFVVQWDPFFFSKDSTNTSLNRARHIDPFMLDVLKNTDTFATLAARNLLRGNEVGLPTGQKVHKYLKDIPALSALSFTKLTQEELNFNDVLNTPELLGIFEHSPLWFYVLAEANAHHNGLRLGTVGSLIVGGTVLGVLKSSGSGAFNNPGSNYKYVKLNNLCRMVDLIQLAS